MSSGNVELDSISANIPVLKNAVGGILMCDNCHRKLLGCWHSEGALWTIPRRTLWKYSAKYFMGLTCAGYFYNSAANSRRRVNWSWPLRELGASSGGPFAANLAFEMFVLMM